MEHVKRQLLLVNNVKYCVAIFIYIYEIIQDIHDTFTKLYKHYDALRDNTVCIFKDEDDFSEFGVIDLFIAGVDPTVLVHKMTRLNDAILQQAGHPCRHSLQDYQEANLLGKYVVPVEYQTRNLSEIRVDSIIGKAVIVDADSTSYAVVQPNTFERH